MVNKRHFALLIFFCGAVMAQGEDRYVAQIAAGGGNGLRIETTITMVNLGTEILNPARVTVEAFDNLGTATDLLKQTTLGGLQAVASVERELPGRGTAAVESFSADGSLQTGWARIVTEDQVAVEVLFSIYDGAGRLITTTSILPRAAVADATLLVNVNAATSLASALAVLNPPSNGEAALVQIQVYDAFGNSVGSGDIELEPGERISRNWTEIVPALEGLNNFVGSAEISSNLPLILLPLRQDGVDLTAQETLAAR